MTRYHPSAIVPGSIRQEREVKVNTYMDVQCGSCGYVFERLIRSERLEPVAWSPYEPKRTARCDNCNRLCNFEDASAEGINVIPMRRRSS